MGNELAIHLQNVQVMRERNLVLSVDDFRLEEGDVCAFMGPNGAGKTTFLNVLLGLLPMAAGSVTLWGNKLSASDKTSWNQLRCQIGYVPQLSMVAGEFPLTVQEIVMSGCAAAKGFFKRLSKEERAEGLQWLERLGIAHLKSRCLNEISGGELRKVMLARAMVQHPRLLLLDEYTANLDMGWREQIIATIQSLYEETKLTCILVCHELETVPVCCKRVLLLQQGQVLADGAMESVFTPARIQSLYNCSMEIVHRNGRYFAIPQVETVSDRQEGHA